MNEARLEQKRMVTRTIIEGCEALVWVSARTDIGMRRASNEDSMLVADLATGTAAMCASMNVYEPDRGGMLMAVSLVYPAQGEKL